MIHEIVIGLLVSAICALCATAYRRGHLHGIIDEIMFRLSSSSLDKKDLSQKEVKAVRSRLVRLLMRDQSLTGVHRGQYGKSCGAHGSAKWQSKGSGENMDLKPRVYLTYWPVFLLHKHNLAAKSRHLAVKGIAKLFRGDRIPVFSSEADSSPTKRSAKWNFRHTMAGAHLLAIATPNNGITRSVVDQMIDERNEWQSPNGGWWHTSERKHAPDLWASAYAVKLLDYVLASDIATFRDKKDTIRSAIQRTIGFLEAEFDARSWGEPGKLLVEENLVSLFIDLAPILASYGGALREKCLHAMKKWLSPTGDLSKQYLEVLSKQSDPTPSETAYTRMAYAFYLAKDDSVNWHPWFEMVSRASQERLYSAELAFLIDLSFAYEQEQSRQPPLSPDEDK